MQRRRPLVRLAPVAFGYGPLGKALHIARAVRARVGEAVRLELVAGMSFAAASEPGLFDTVCGSAEDCIETADAVVTLMNANGVRAFVARGERVHVVDSLAWLWDQPLPVAGALRYYYQDIPVLPVPERNLRGLPRPVAIAPIGCLGDGTVHTEGWRGGTSCVITLSGLQSPLADVGGGAVQYARYVLGAVDRITRARREPLDVAIFGNRVVLDRAVTTALRPSLGSGTQVDFARAALGAGRVVASPGLTTIIECLRGGVPLALLPPQNFSQAKILAAFLRAGIVGHNWPSHLSDWLATAVLPERVGAEIVSGVIARSRAERGVMPPQDLERLVDGPLPPIQPGEIGKMLGDGDGAAQVAEHVLSDLVW